MPEDLSTPKKSIKQLEKKIKNTQRKINKIFNLYKLAKERML